MLVDHSDAGVYRVLGRIQFEAVPIQINLSLVLCVQPVQNLHQSTLTGAVFAEQAVYLAVLDGQVYVVVRYHAGELLQNVFHL